MGAPDPVAREVNGDLLCRRKIPQKPNDRGVGARGLGGLGRIFDIQYYPLSQ